MAEPITTGLILAGISVGSKVAGDLYHKLTNRDLYDLQKQVFERQKQHISDLQRRSRGKFTNAELAAIRANAEPQVNAVSANVAARLGVSSPAGVALVNQAQQAPILAAQQAATAAYSPALTALSGALKDRLGQLSGDKSFLGDLAAISETYKTLKNLEKNSNGRTPNNPPKALGNPEETALNKLIGQGYQNSLV